MADFHGTGWKFPVRVNARGGLSWVSGSQSIEESIWLILSTPLKSRVMEPRFGCGIHQYLFAPNDTNTRALIIRAVQQALLKWEPRIDLLDVRGETTPGEPNHLLIHVDYRIRANNAFHNLVYPFYINEGLA
ncbi:GPW/gp25 family protein [Marinobacter lacisalsi]|uniref:GPW/gp25 family protein n=1 Tax=Marinobacter lacisalsi TaxID=475979 RepID=A0ABV8QMM5_9GAMM